MGKIISVGVPSAALGTGSSELRAASAVRREKSVRRSAQDDDFVGAFGKHIRHEM